MMLYHDSKQTTQQSMAAKQSTGSSSNHNLLENINKLRHILACYKLYLIQIHSVSNSFKLAIMFYQLKHWGTHVSFPVEQEVSMK